jgi:glycosyltransferase involved in cell wall biosynthesis
LADDSRLRVVNLGVDSKATFSYHARRQWRHLVAAAVLARFRDRGDGNQMLVTCPAGYALWYVIGLIAFARILGYEILVCHHSFAYINRRSLVMWILVRAAGAQGEHVLLCDRMRARFDHHYRPARPSTVCSNAYWTAFTAPGADTGNAIRSRSLGDALRVGHLGTLTEAKGVFELPELVNSLAARGVDAELWLGGSPPTTRDEALLESALAGLGSRARWLGPLRGHRKSAFFRDIDAFVLPTRYRHEAQPLVVFEALQAGVPVIAYEAGCIPEQLRSCGLLVPQTERLAERALPYLRDLAQDPAALEAAQTAARRTFRAAALDGEKEARALLDKLRATRR